jgi:hypothetical protein
MDPGAGLDAVEKRKFLTLPGLERVLTVVIMIREQGNILQKAFSRYE